MVACQEIGQGERHEPELLGDITRIEPITVEGAYDTMLNSTRVHQNKQLLQLLQRYTKRSSFAVATKQSNENGANNAS